MFTSKRIPTESEISDSFAQLRVSQTPRPHSPTPYKDALLAQTTLLENLPPPNPTSLAASRVSRTQFVESLLEKLGTPAYTSIVLHQLLQLISPPPQILFDSHTSKEKWILSSLIANVTALASSGRHEPLRLLFHGLLVSRSLSFDQALLLSAQILLLGEERFDTSSLSAFCGDVDAKFQVFLQASMKRWTAHIETLSSSGIYPHGYVRARLLPIRMAELLILPSGSVNVGLVPKLLEALLPPPQSRDSLERHIAYMADQLQSQPEVIHAIETIPSLPANTLGFRVVNATLLRSQSQPVHSFEVRRAVLATCLTFWRQKQAANCCPNSLLTQRQTMGLRWFVADLTSLLTKGYITRMVQGSEIRFTGAEASEPLVLDIQLGALHPGADAWITTTLKEQLFISPVDIESAFQSHPLTLRSLFESLALTHPKEAIHHCQSLIEAPIQNPLLTLLENALGSSYFTPLSPGNFSCITDQRRLYNMVLSIFHTIACDFKLHPLSNRIHATLPSVSLENPSAPYCGILLRSIKNIRMEWKISEEQTPSSLFLGNLQIVQETEAGLKPISRKEFASLLYATFTAMYVEVYGKTTLPQEILPSLFEQFLAKQGLKEEGSYKVPGMQTLQYSPEMDIKNGRLLPCTARSARSFLLWLQRFRIDTNPHQSVLALKPHHQFRLLPNHPSIPALNDLSSLKLRSQIFAQKPLLQIGDKRIVLDNLKVLICRLLAAVHDKIWFGHLPTTFFRTTDEELDSIARNLAKQLEERFDTFTVSSAGCLIRTMIKTEIINTLAPLRPELKTMRREELEFAIVLPLSPHDMFFQVFLKLLSLQPEFENILLHFADSNYATTSFGTQEALHYCLWFSPFTEKWEIVKAPESNRWAIKVEVLPVQFSDFAVVDS